VDDKKKGVVFSFGKGFTGEYKWIRKGKYSVYYHNLGSSSKGGGKLCFSEVAKSEAIYRKTIPEKSYREKL